MSTSSKQRRIATGLSALLCLWIAAGCGSSDRPAADGEASSRPNVILISVDTLRADHLGCYGYLRATSPFIDSLARRGVRFDRAFAQSSWTLPSHMSLMTSLYPHGHRVQADNRTLPSGVVTLAEALRRDGYSTQAFVSWVYVSARFGFDRGFDGFEELVPPRELLDSGTRHAAKAEAVVDRVLEWSESPPGEPFLLFVHLFDPHVNYDPPLEHSRMFDPDAVDTDLGSYSSLSRYIKGLRRDAERIPPDRLRRVTALYDAEIRYTDSQLQRLFDTLESRGLLENALIVLTSDHGEELDDHGSMEGHQWTLYDEVTRIPLLMVLPDGAHAGEVRPGIVQSIDVAPTILSLAGVNVPDAFRGRDLTPRIEDTNAAADPGFAFSQTNRFNRKWSVRTATRKLIHTIDTGTNPFGVPIVPGYELFDLVADPGEQRDIYDRNAPEVAPLMGYLNDALRAGPALPDDGVDPGLTPEERERLRSLGYVDGN